ncbi:LLM class flavin-dependent oxidoreductase [Amycolatopsis sp. cmx-4-83]|uniref:LLM class flavin-dependent oxidoreductase n=1 Tax=Amycolatopsis sp. cmx-4-83 TaxID=2790940 RepID=UPI003978E925
MTLEFIGYAAGRQTSETIAPDGPTIQPHYLREIARTHEQAGFDRVLIAQSASSPDGFVLADQVLAATERLGVLLAHRPGFVAPTQLARKFATLDAFHPGRVALHVITGGDDADQARDGDFTDKPTRYRRTDDFLSVVRRTWESAEPFDHDGEFYRVRGALSDVRPERPIPVYFGGASTDAIRVGGKHADVYAFWGEPLAGIAERIDQVRAAAAGRDVAFSVSLRPIPAATEAEAWERARDVLRLTQDRVGEFKGRRDSTEAVGSRRLLEAAATGDVVDERLWTAVAKTTGAAGNSTALVGSYEQVADSLLDYVRLGVGTLLIRGFSPLADARDYGTLVRLVRERADATDPAKGRPTPARHATVATKSFGRDCGRMGNDQHSTVGA